MATKQPAFQIHVDEPDGACSKKHVALKAKPRAEDSPLKLNPDMTRLRKPLATIDVPSAMDVIFGR